MCTFASLFFIKIILTFIFLNLTFLIFDNSIRVFRISLRCYFLNFNRFWPHTTIQYRTFSYTITLTIIRTLIIFHFIIHVSFIFYSSITSSIPFSYCGNNFLDLDRKRSNTTFQWRTYSLTITFTIIFTFMTLLFIKSIISF